MLSTIRRALNLIHVSGVDGLKEEIEKLDKKLGRIQVTIDEEEHREIHYKAVNFWLEELKSLVSDGQDILDEYHYEILHSQLDNKPVATTVLSGQVSGMESNMAMLNHISPYFFIEKIRKINSRFDEISRDREALRLTNEEGKKIAGTSSIKLSSSSHLMNKDNIFGRDNDKDKIIDRLLSGVLGDEEWKDQIRVLPILGMGGIGKTTLAQMVYHDLSIKSSFDVMAWVYVSPDFDIIRLVKEICEFVTGDHGNSFCGFSMIQQVLQEKLVGKKMFLVLDDVWNVQKNDWEMLFLPLRVAKLVRVLVTSRNEVVRRAPFAVSPHRLHKLPEHECLKLLYHCAFGGKELTEKQWSLDIGRQIIKKCGGLPLAIKCIGRVLHFDTNKFCWREILDSELWESDEIDPIFCALMVSYHHLPTKLRDCFLFCSLFPKGSQLRKTSIIYMWMAHGFTQPRGRKRAEDIGEEYLAELQMRSLIVPRTKGSFCLHDVIYDLAKALSGGEIHTVVNEKSGIISDTIKHLYIKKGTFHYEYFNPRFLRPRTLFDATQRSHESSIDLHDISSVRVLGLIGPNVLALEHSQLKHLRFLAIIEFNGKTLPESLCLLYHLQTLEITRCHYLCELPKKIANLVNLCYLHIAHVGIEELPYMLWRINNLQTLRLKECYNLRRLPNGISDLSNLHTLQLKSCRKLEELPADTGELINLSLLDLSFSGIRTFPSSICRLYSAKVVLAGIPDSVKIQLYLNLINRRNNGYKGPLWEDAETLIVASVEEGLSSLAHHKRRMETLNMQTRQEYPSGISRKIRSESTPTIAEDTDYTIAGDTDSGIPEDIDSQIVEGIDFGSRVTWMSSQNQSSIRGYCSQWKMPIPKGGVRFEPRVKMSRPKCELTEDEMIFALDLESDMQEMMDEDLCGLTQ
ncbi:Disease resistance protein (CC-NBS-LRR class) family [Rhynchospora pubera]|uniref:Disease resistance protein (CC-NBS-LRR class) family n=1 Tax=Rhynchospora pubera TaxID=906938 RepID=A0AAV8D3T3_9POAL|nr:Disease resistance protein (CC-NBS-LRR class) family [Rhynchospora pubera]